MNYEFILEVYGTVSAFVDILSEYTMTPQLWILIQVLRVAQTLLQSMVTEDYETGTLLLREDGDYFPTTARGGNEVN